MVLAVLLEQAAAVTMRGEDILDNLLGTFGLILKLAIFLAFIAIGFGVYSYNKLQNNGQAVKSATATVLTVIQKRADMINKLMDIAKDYGNHEKLVHIRVSQNLMETFKTSNVALATVNSMALNYPDLKANVTYQQLMQQIHAIENELQQKREWSNRVVQTYNSDRLQIPTIFFSKILGFQEAPYFDFDNLQSMREFNTDDGELLKEMLSNASVKAVNMTQQGVRKVRTKINQASSKSEQVFKNAAESRVSNKSATNQQGSGILCKFCSTINSYDDKFCIQCGRTLAVPVTKSDKKICLNCSAANNSRSLFCAKCGAKL